MEKLKIMTGYDNMKYTIRSIILLLISMLLLVIFSLHLGKIAFFAPLLSLLASICSVVAAIKSKHDLNSSIFIRVLVIILNIPIILYSGLSSLLFIYFFNNAWNGVWI